MVSTTAYHIRSRRSPPAPLTKTYVAYIRNEGDKTIFNLGLAGHAGDGGAGAGNPPALHKRRPPSRLRQMPSYQLASLSASEDQNVKVFELRHDLLRVPKHSRWLTPLHVKRTDRRLGGHRGLLLLLGGI